MNQAFFYMLQLLKSGILGEQPPPPDGVDWTGVQEEAVVHRVSPVVYRAVMGLPGELRPEPELMAKWRQEVMLAGFRQMNKELCLNRILRRMENGGVKAVLLKGYVLAALYPSTVDREMVDVDLLVLEDELERAGELLGELGYVYADQLSSDNEDTYTNELLNVEVHTRLWEESGGARFDKLGSLGIGLVSQAVRTKVTGEDVWVMRPQEMLFYLVYHMVKHFFVCGIGVRYLSDMALYVNRYAAEIDWSRFWDEISSLQYVTFTKSFFYLCHTYMGMSIEGTGMPAFEQDEILAAEKMLRDMQEGGHNGARTIVRYKAGRVLRIYYENEGHQLPRSKLEILKRLFFPNREELKNMKTAHDKKSGFILFAWLQHVSFLYRTWQSRRQERCSMQERLRCAQERLDMLHSLGLIR